MHSMKSVAVSAAALSALILLTPSCAFTSRPIPYAVSQSLPCKSRTHMTAEVDDDMDDLLRETNAALQAAKGALQDADDEVAAQEIKAIKSMPNSRHPMPSPVQKPDNELQAATVDTLKAFGGVLGGLAKSIAESVVEEMKSAPDKIEKKRATHKTKDSVDHLEPLSTVMESVTISARPYATTSKSRLYMMAQKDEGMEDRKRGNIDKALQVAKRAIRDATMDGKESSTRTPVGPVTHDFSSTSPYKVSLKHKKVRNVNVGKLSTSKESKDLPDAALGALQTFGRALGGFSKSLANSVVEEMKAVPGKVGDVAVMSPPKSQKDIKHAAVGALKSFGGALGGFTMSVAEIAIKEVKKVPNKIADATPTPAYSSTLAFEESSDLGTKSLLSIPSTMLKDNEIGARHHDVDKTIPVDATTKSTIPASSLSHSSPASSLSHSSPFLNLEPQVSVSSGPPRVSKNGKSEAIQKETVETLDATKVGKTNNENTSKTADKLVPDVYSFTSNSPYKVLPKVGTKHSAQPQSLQGEKSETKESSDGVDVLVAEDNGASDSSTTSIASDYSSTALDSKMPSDVKGMSTLVNSTEIESSTQAMSDQVVASVEELTVENLNTYSDPEPSIVAHLRRASTNSDELQEESNASDIDVCTSKDPDPSFLASLNSSSTSKARDVTSESKDTSEEGVTSAVSCATTSATEMKGAEEAPTGKPSTCSESLSSPSSSSAAPTTAVDILEKDLIQAEREQPTAATDTTAKELEVAHALKKASSLPSSPVEIVTPSMTSNKQVFDDDEATDSLRRYIQARARDMTLRRLDQGKNTAVPTFIAPVVEDPYEPRAISTAAAIAANSLKRHPGVKVSRKAQRSVLLAAAATGALVVGKRLLSVAVGGGLF